MWLPLTLFILSVLYIETAHAMMPNCEEFLEPSHFEGWEKEDMIKYIQSKVVLRLGKYSQLDALNDDNETSLMKYCSNVSHYKNMSQKEEQQETPAQPARDQGVSAAETQEKKETSAPPARDQVDIPNYKPLSAEAEELLAQAGDACAKERRFSLGEKVVEVVVAVKKAVVGALGIGDTNKNFSGRRRLMRRLEKSEREAKKAADLQ